MSSKDEALARMDVAVKDMPIQPRHWTAAEDEILLRGWGKIERGVILQVLNEYQRTNRLKVRSEMGMEKRAGRLRGEI